MSTILSTDYEVLLVFIRTIDYVELDLEEDRSIIEISNSLKLVQIKQEGKFER